MKATFQVFGVFINSVLFAESQNCGQNDLVNRENVCMPLSSCSDNCIDSCNENLLIYSKEFINLTENGFDNNQLDNIVYPGTDLYFEFNFFPTALPSLWSNMLHFGKDNKDRWPSFWIHQKGSYWFNVAWRLRGNNNMRNSFSYRISNCTNYNVKVWVFPTKMKVSLNGDVKEQDFDFPEWDLSDYENVTLPIRSMTKEN